MHSRKLRVDSLTVMGPCMGSFRDFQPQPAQPRATSKSRRRLDTAGKWNIVVAWGSIGTGEPSRSSLNILEIAPPQSHIGDQCAEYPEDLSLRYALGLGRLDDEPPTTHVHLHWDADTKTG